MLEELNIGEGFCDMTELGEEIVETLGCGENSMEAVGEAVGEDKAEVVGLGDGIIEVEEETLSEGRVLFEIKGCEKTGDGLDDGTGFLDEVRIVDEVALGEDNEIDGKVVDGLEDSEAIKDAIGVIEDLGLDDEKDEGGDEDEDTEGVDSSEGLGNGTGVCCMLDIGIVFGDELTIIEEDVPGDEEEYCDSGGSTGEGEDDIDCIGSLDVLVDGEGVENAITFVDGDSFGNEEGVELKTKLGDGDMLGKKMAEEDGGKVV